MKLSISVSQEDLAVLDKYARASGLRSRSAAIRHAIRLLRNAELEHEYEAAWDDWVSSGERAAWEGTIGDGQEDAAL